MRLRDFIINNSALIVGEWQQFTKTLMPAARKMSSLALKDHIEEILDDIVTDMDRAQSAPEQEAKSKGEQRQIGPDSAAQTHASGRADSGFSIEQLTAEFRALRASVIRLWTKHREQATNQDFIDLTRFNEAIDQALSESLVRFSSDLEQSRELFIGILGHDLRTPLQAIMGSGELLARSTHPEKNLALSSVIVASANRMNHLITDLLELTRVRLGNGISIYRAQVNLKQVCLNVINEIKAIYPSRSIEIDIDDNVSGQWDKARIAQVLSNLIGNAVQHGAAETPIIIKGWRENKEIKIAIHNEGKPIPLSSIDRVFQSFVQGLEQRKQDEKNPTSLGLGLYIAKEIVTAHGGTISVTSTAKEGTTFLVTLGI